jgi:IS30 family transposase
MSGAEPLCMQEREIISWELNWERSARFIGKLLGRHHSTLETVRDRDTDGAALH